MTDAPRDLTAERAAADKIMRMHEIRAVYGCHRVQLRDAILEALQQTRQRGGMSMKKHVILTLRYDLGEYDEEDLREMNAGAWDETFYQSDVFPGDMKIVGVEYEEQEAP